MNPLKRNISSDSNEASTIKKSKQDGVKPPLPKELTAMFQPLYCVLCKAQLSSPLTASGHYIGKPHQKKVKQYLLQNFSELLPAEETTSASKKSVTTSEQICSSLTPDQAASCRICNVVFAGPIAAQSHYSGKKHRSKVLKGYKPIEPVPGMYVEEDASGRFGIGESFRKPEEHTSTPLPSLTRTVQKWYCDICNTQMTDDNQYKAHLSGKKHIKNVNKMKILDSGLTPNPKANPKDSILNSVIKKPKHGVEGDFSMHRTPSGEYYCKVCDLTVNSVSQFSDHLVSKNHKKKVANSTSTPVKK